MDYEMTDLVTVVHDPRLDGMDAADAWENDSVASYATAQEDNQASLATLQTNNCRTTTRSLRPDVLNFPQCITPQATNIYQSLQPRWNSVLHDQGDEVECVAPTSEDTNTLSEKRRSRWLRCFSSTYLTLLLTTVSIALTAYYFYDQHNISSHDLKLAESSRKVDEWKDCHSMPEIQSSNRCAQLMNLTYDEVVQSRQSATITSRSILEAFHEEVTGLIGIRKRSTDRESRESSHHSEQVDESAREEGKPVRRYEGLSWLSSHNTIERAIWTLMPVFSMPIVMNTRREAGTTLYGLDVTIMSAIVAALGVTKSLLDDERDDVSGHLVTLGGVYIIGRMLVDLCHLPHGERTTGRSRDIGHDASRWKITGEVSFYAALLCVLYRFVTHQRIPWSEATYKEMASQTCLSALLLYVLYLCAISLFPFRSNHTKHRGTLS